MPALRHLDLVLLVLALPLFLLTGLPVAGWGLAAVLWIVLGGLRGFLQRRADRSDDPRAVIGYVMGGAIARAWLAALCVLVVGMLTSDAIGLSAIVTLIALFTIELGTRAAQRTNSRLEAAAPSGPGVEAGREGERS